MIHIHSPPSPPRPVSRASGTRYSLLQKNRERESEFREINECEFYVTRVPDTMQAGTSSSFEIAAECSRSIVVIDKRVSRLISECPMLSRARARARGPRSSLEKIRAQSSVPIDADRVDVWEIVPQPCRFAKSFVATRFAATRSCDFPRTERERGSFVNILDGSLEPR